ncbi:hypothetical protein PENSPDRAFT_339622 [Peniophora sp. CONT]|nr:hypothetical protein PENSPDRAFT_339622 [Peniophora sp. CONT]
MTPDMAFAEVTAVSHLDAAMAQITSIYPLTVFILVALDKIYHSRGPRTAHNEERTKEPQRDYAVTVTFDVDVERSALQNPGFAYPLIELRGRDENKSTTDDTQSRSTA